MSLVYHGLFRPLRRRRDPFAHYFDDVCNIVDFVTNSGEGRQSAQSETPRVNLENLESSCIIRMATPGLSRDDLEVSLSEGKLSISYEQEETKNSNFRFQKAFRQSWTLGDAFDEEKITANYSDGVLTVEVPRNKEVTPSDRRIEIN